MKILIAGWFSYELCNVTAGDLMARDIVCEWVKSAGYLYDVAVVPPLTDGVNWRSVNPKNYSHVIFVCGPFPYMKLTTEFVEYFNSSRLIGIDLSMIESIDAWNPFDVLIERDSSATSHPDITLISQQKKVPVVGVILVHPQDEYKNKGKHHIANEAINRLIASREMVAVPIDTGLDPNTTNLRTAAEVESLIARMDFVVTTRLHGTVLALKNGVPAIAIDAISGGAKVLRQAQTIGWSCVFSIDNLSDEDLHQAFEYCQTEEARIKALECRDNAIQVIEQIRDKLLWSLDEKNLQSARVWRKEALDNSLLETPKPSITQLALHQARELKKGTIKFLVKQIQ